MSGFTVIIKTTMDHQVRLYTDHHDHHGPPWTTKSGFVVIIMTTMDYHIRVYGDHHDSHEPPY